MPLSCCLVQFWQSYSSHGESSHAMGNQNTVWGTKTQGRESRKFGREPLVFLNSHQWCWNMSYNSDNFSWSWSFQMSWFSRCPFLVLLAHHQKHVASHLLVSGYCGIHTPSFLKWTWTSSNGFPDALWMTACHMSHHLGSWLSFSPLIGACSSYGGPLVLLVIVQVSLWDNLHHALGHLTGPIMHPQLQKGLLPYWL